MSFSIPTLSVLMPVFNTREACLRKSIESILNQTFKDFELIVCDDGSSVATPKEVVKSYADRRIVYLKNEANKGISFTRNRLLSVARGKYLAITDHDDISLPNRFEEQVSVLEKHPEIGVVGAWIERFPKRKIVRFPVEHDDICEAMFFSCPLQHPAVMLRKDIMTGVSYDESFSPAEDYALFASLMGKTKFYNIPRVLLKYRLDETTTTSSRKRRMQANAIRVQTDLRRKHAKLWDSVRGLYAKVFRFELFSCIPLLTIRREPTKIRFYLFGKIFFLTIRPDVIRLKERTK